MLRESKLFSKSLETTKLWSKLRANSVSEADALSRQKVYSEYWSKWEDMKNAFKTFSSAGDTDLQANQYFNATTAGLANSWAGYLSIERNMDASIALLYYLDVLNVGNGQTVLPNVGLENIDGFQNKIDISTGITTNATLTYSILLGKKVIPGTLTLEFTVNGATFEAKDDKNGGLLAPAGTLGSATVNYTTGLIDITLASGSTVVANDQIRTIALEDQVDTSGINRFKTKLSHYEIITKPELLIAEMDLPSLAAMQKVTGLNIQTFLVGKLSELYTKMINNELTRSLVNGATGSNIIIDPNAGNNTTYRSTLDRFGAGLNEVDSVLGQKSVKGLNATSYLVGYDLATQFTNMSETGKFVKAAGQGYVDDLIGFYDGRPVLQHKDVDAKQGYAIHKTADGQLAPVGRGLFLPLTSTPQVGDYNNPAQLAQGVYYQEGTKCIEPVLIQKFVLQ